MIRRRAGLSQEELAARAGMSRRSLARYEHGEREPSYADLVRLAAAAGLDLTTSLARVDRSLLQLVDDQLAIEPLERLRAMVRPTAQPTERALVAVTELAPEHVLVGDVADVLHGSPQTTAGALDVVLPQAVHAEMPDRLLDAGAWPAEESEHGRQAWELPDGGLLRLVAEPPGTRGYPDLVGDAQRIALVGLASDERQRELNVASVLDLLRIAEACGAWSRVRRPGLIALLEAGAASSAAAA